MKFLSRVIALIVKGTVLAAGVVVAMEAVDRIREREQSRYLVDEDFED